VLFKNEKGNQNARNSDIQWTNVEIA